MTEVCQLNRALKDILMKASRISVPVAGQMAGGIRRFEIVRASAHGHVTDDVVRRLEDDVSSATGWPIKEPCSGPFQKLARACAALSMPFPLRKNRDLFMVMMGAHRFPLNAADWGATKGRKVAWAFDVWPASYQAIVEYLQKYRIDYLFVTSKQSAERLERAVSGCDVKWCAEPFIDLGFKCKPWEDRTTDVLQMGRRHPKYHERLAAGGRHAYKFEETPGVVVFPTMTEFLLGLADAKVSVCFTSDLTHPERAGDVATVTQRYFQSMASGCVIVGNTPQELINLFGYDPVVKADLDDPAGQIDAILAAPGKYQELVQKNRIELQNHTTAERVATILRELG